MNFPSFLSNFVKIHSNGIGYFSFSLFCAIAYYIAYLTNYPVNLAGQYLLGVWIVGLVALFIRNILREIS